MATQLVDANGNAIIADVASSGSLTGTGSITSTLRGQAATVITVSGTWVGTLVFEGSVDNFANSTIAMTVWPVAAGAGITSTTANGSWIVMASGLTQFRVRCSAFTSGTIVIAMNSSQAGNEQTIISGIAQSSTSANQFGQIVMGNVTTAAPAYTTAQSNPLSLTTGGSTRTDWSSQAGTAITAVPVAVGTGAPSGNAPAVNAAVFGGVSPAGSARAATAPTGGIMAGAIGQNTNPTSVTSGQLVGVAADLSGRIITTPFNYRTLIKHQATSLAASTETTIITAGGASVFNDLLALIITTTGLVAATITIRDVTAGGTPWIIDYPNAAVAPGVPFVVSFATPLQQGTANSAWTVTNSVTTSTHITAQYVQRLA